MSSLVSFSVSRSSRSIMLRVSRVSRWVVYVIQQHGSTWFESRPQNSSNTALPGSSQDPRTLTLPQTKARKRRSDSEVYRYDNSWESVTKPTRIAFYNKKLSYCLETARCESLPKIAEVKFDVSRNLANQMAAALPFSYKLWQSRLKWLSYILQRHQNWHQSKASVCTL